MTEEMKMKRPEDIRIRTARGKALSDEELENAAGGKCWFWHDYKVIENSVHPEGLFRKCRCRDCGNIIYVKNEDEISKAEYERVRNDGRSYWGIFE